VPYPDFVLKKISSTIKGFFFGWGLSDPGNCATTAITVLFRGEMGTSAWGGNVVKVDRNGAGQQPIRFWTNFQFGEMHKKVLNIVTAQIAIRTAQIRTMTAHFV